MTDENNSGIDDANEIPATDPTLQILSDLATKVAALEANVLSLQTEIANRIEENARLHSLLTGVSNNQEKVDDELATINARIKEMNDGPVNDIYAPEGIDYSSWWNTVAHKWFSADAPAPN